MKIQLFQNGKKTIGVRWIHKIKRMQKESRKQNKTGG